MFYAITSTIFSQQLAPAEAALPRATEGLGWDLRGLKKGLKCSNVPLRHVFVLSRPQNAYISTSWINDNVFQPPHTQKITQLR